MSALVVGLVAAVAVMGLTVLSSGALLIERHRVASAADAVALVAADTAAGLVPGSPCEVAARLAEASRVHLAACLIEGTTVTVRTRSLGRLALIGTSATAGQPQAGETPGRGVSMK